jgi:hypothetical protein
LGDQGFTATLLEEERHLARGEARAAAQIVPGCDLGDILRLLITTGVILALLAGIALKLWIFGPGG